MASVLLKTQLAIAEHALPCIKNATTHLGTSGWWLWINSALEGKLMVALGPVTFRERTAPSGHGDGAKG